MTINITQAQMPKSKLQIKSKTQSPKKYDLKDRTAKFGENVIKLSQSLPNNNINQPLIRQVIRSSTSVGANYMEADGAESKKDFKHKIAICKKEAKESMHWLHMLAVANQEAKQRCRFLWQEAHELTLIFSSIINSCHQ